MIDILPELYMNLHISTAIHRGLCTTGVYKLYKSSFRGSAGAVWGPFAVAVRPTGRRPSMSGWWAQTGLLEIPSYSSSRRDTVAFHENLSE